MTEKTAEKPAEVWRDGFPDKKGWYHCKIDGERVQLLHFICAMSGRHEWVTASGDYVTGDGVQWTGAPLAAPVR